MARWTVITETALLSRVRDWGIDGERKLFAIQEVCREDGPDAFGLHAPYHGARSWDQLAAPCTVDFFIEVGRSKIWALLDILPGRTIVFRRGRVE